MKYILLIITIILLCVFLYSSNKTEHFNNSVPNLNLTFSYLEGNKVINDDRIIINIDGAITNYDGSNAMLIAGLWDACNSLYIAERALEKNCDQMKQKLSDMNSSSEHFQNSSNSFLDKPEKCLKCYGSSNTINTVADTGFDWPNVMNVFPAIGSKQNNYKLVPILWKMSNNLYIRIKKLQEDFNDINDKINQMN